MTIGVVPDFWPFSTTEAPRGDESIRMLAVGPYGETVPEG